MWRAGLVALVLVVVGDVAQAQPWGPPYNRGYSTYPRASPGFFGWGWNDDYYYRFRRGPAVQSGGGRPVVEPLAPKVISFPSTYPVGSILIDSKGRQLFFIQSPTEALHYPISVGREGFSWAGTEAISRKAEWPDWHPPEEMRDRDPSLPEKMTGGLKNPLGAMALYLGTSLYRIHGTNDAKSIGRAASSGCFRLLNGHIVDLTARVEIGTPVTVVHRLAPELEKTVADQVRPPQPQSPQAQVQRPQAETKPPRRVLLTPDQWPPTAPPRQP
ncbi:MAG TPA: L,D-transpeptidase [Hyphomicrobiaceae bacterium]|nr:L,D-transpeptidase [Hyphomicrobiaceae bacterium]